MKVLHCTDIHISGRNPQARIDNLVDLQFDKLDEVISISEHLKIPIIITGDIFEQPNISYSIYSDLAEILSKSNYGIYLIVGNHDLMWYNIASIKATALGALLRSVPSVKRVQELYIDYGINFGFCDWEQPIIGDKKSSILISHKAVVPSKFKKTIWSKEKINPHFWFEDDKELKQYNLILCGHYHKQYTSDDFKVISNPGSLTRRKANKDEIEHIPTINIVDLDNCSIRPIILKCAKESNLVFNKEHVDNLQFERKEENEIQQFLMQITDKLKKRRFEGSNLLEILLKMVNSDEIANNQKEIIRESLKEIYGNKININIEEENFSHDKVLDIPEYTKPKKRLILRKKLK